MIYLKRGAKKKRKKREIIRREKLHLWQANFGNDLIFQYLPWATAYKLTQLSLLVTRATAFRMNLDALNFNHCNISFACQFCFGRGCLRLKSTKSGFRQEGSE